jgi:hypothetical protein
MFLSKGTQIFFLLKVNKAIFNNVFEAFNLLEYVAEFQLHGNVIQLQLLSTHSSGENSGMACYW